MRRLIGSTAIMVLAPIWALLPIGNSSRSASVECPNLAIIFSGNYQQIADQFGTVSRSALGASGRWIGTQVGHAGGPNGIVVETTYLEPDSDHPLGQAFDGAGNPLPLHTGPGHVERPNAARH